MAEVAVSRTLFVYILQIIGKLRLPPVASTCACRKFDPNAAMMKSMRLLDRLDPPIALDFMGERRILHERLMRTKFIVIIFMAPQNIMKMCFIDDNKLIDALAANRADLAFCKCLLRWCSGCGGIVPDSLGSLTFLLEIAINAIMVTNKITRRLVGLKSLCYLLCKPFHRGMPGDIAPDN